MRQISTFVLSALAAFSATGVSTSTASAAVWGGWGVGPGTPRVVSGVNQLASAASNATSYLTVQRCTGVIEYPVFVPAGPTCTAIGPDYAISMTVISSTQTEVRIVATAASCGIKAVTFGSPNSMCGFDMTTPNPGTAGSLTGSNPVPVAGTLIGAWTSSVRFDNRVNLVGAAPAGDLYSRMSVFFSSCFDVGDQIVFRVDTDKLY
jgi:hypothetical protein